MSMSELLLRAMCGSASKATRMKEEVLERQKHKVVLCLQFSFYLIDWVGEFLCREMLKWCGKNIEGPEVEWDWGA